MADVDSSLYQWSTTESSNKPTGGTTVGPGLDDNLRQIQATVRAWLASKGADIASATTTDLGAVAGLAHDITGTTTITSFGTVAAGIWKILKFEGALTLTHNATSLILLGGENHTTADGDVGIYISEGSGNWRELAYFPVAINPAKMVSTDEAQTLTNKTIGAATISGTQTGSGTPTYTGMGPWSGTTGTFSGTLTPQGLVDISGASAGQIQFPASQNASANANTLDDYEEGSWTLALVNWTNTGSPTLTGRYVKVGRQVTVIGLVSPATDVSATTITSTVTGLPFTVANPGFSSCSAALLTGGQLQGGLLFSTTMYPPTTGVTTAGVVLTATYFV